MNKGLTIKTVLLALFIFISNSSFSKVDARNYNFSLDQFSSFFPGQSIQKIIKDYPNSKIVTKTSSSIIYKFDIEHMRYKFPILVQIVDGKVADFHARLPQYFLHNIFHQAIINRYGKQNVYKKTEESALYIWNKKEFIITYSGACTITCFPIFYSVRSKGKTYGGDYKTLTDGMLD